MQIGADVVGRELREVKVNDRLSTDLHKAFPSMNAPTYSSALSIQAGNILESLLPLGRERQQAATTD